MEEITKEQAGSKLECTGCGAYLKYTPGTQHLTCEYCGAENEISLADEAIEELDFFSFLEDKDLGGTYTEHFVKCESCNATSTLDAKLTSAFCPYCSVPLILANAYSENIIQPKSLLPFKLNKDESQVQFKAWIKSLWFAPNDLKSVLSLDNFKGIYIPYWTYDTHTFSKYTGQRGIYYYVTESYTSTENGRSVTKTRQVRKTRWYPASGSVRVNFDDLLVTATKSMPEKHVRALEPWDMQNLIPFDKSYLSGFVTEKYQVDLKQGFEVAKELADPAIRSAIRRDIGGDEQRIDTVDTKYSNITFKHLLFPVYVSSYRYSDKLYRFIINARTGEVQGERPYSWIKITLAVLFALAVIAAIIYFANQKQ